MPFRLVAVEDEPEIAELLRVVLTCPQIVLYGAVTGREGLELIHEIRPHLVVLDVMLPGEMDGWQVFDTLRANPDFHALPIIILTVLRERVERRAAFRDNMLNQYVSKPFDTPVLRAHVERMLGQADLWQAPSRSVRDVIGLLHDANEALDLERRRRRRKGPDQPPS